MFWKSAFTAVITAFMTVTLPAGEVPPLAGQLMVVVSGDVPERWYRTVVELRNDGVSPADCRFEFRSTRNPDAPLIYTETVEAGQSKVINDFLHILPVATTVRVACSADVHMHSRICDSVDGGATYSEGPLFEAVAAKPIPAGKTGSFRPEGTLVVAEVTGKHSTVVVRFTAEKDGEVATKTYDLLPFGLRLLDISPALASRGVLEATVENRGAGNIVLLQETLDPKFTARARRSSTDREAVFPVALNKDSTSPASASADTTTRSLYELSSLYLGASTESKTKLLVGFKGASFIEPATGLVLMRDRWYDSSTGTFLTPDPEHYRDSSNPYIFCAGDPVNCSDPTGRAAAVGQKGWIVGRRPNGTAYRFAPGYASQHALEVQGAFESDTDLTQSDVQRLMAQAHLQVGQTHIPCRLGETCIGADVPSTRYGAADYAIGPAVSAGNSIIGFSNQVNRVNGESDVPPIPYASQRQRWAGDRFDELQTVVAIPALAAAGVNSLAGTPALTVRAFRVEGAPNTRIFISESGNVTVAGDDMLFLNFGSRARAEAFFAQRLRQGMPSIVIKEFDVPYSFVDELRAAAVPERLARQFPGSPILVDPTKAPGQFGLRYGQIRALRGAVIQGSGAVTPP